MDAYIKCILEGTGDEREWWNWKAGEEEEEEEEVGVELEEWGSKSEESETLESVVAGRKKEEGVSVRVEEHESMALTARARRRNISDKMRELESLIPIPSGKMKKGRLESVKMLDEAIKYVRYLKAQVEVVEASVCHFPIPIPIPLTGAGAGAGAKQRLGVLLMSPAIQGNLYSHQCCLCIANYAPAHF